MKARADKTVVVPVPDPNPQPTMMGKGQTKQPPEFPAPKEPKATRANPRKMMAMATGKRRLAQNGALSPVSRPC